MFLAKERKIKRTKTLLHFVATIDGRMPTKPTKLAEDMTKHLAICKKMHPSEDWRVYGIEKDFFNDKTESPCRVSGMSKEKSCELLRKINLRCGTSYTYE